VGIGRRLPIAARSGERTLAQATVLCSDPMDEARRARERGDYDTLLRLLADTDRITRLGAAQELGKLRDQRAVAPLVRCLDAGDRLLRTSAAKSLGAIGDPAAAGALHATAVDDSDCMVRSAAAAELFRLGDQRGFAILAQLMHEPETRSPQGFRRWMARLALDCQTPEAIPHLRAAKRGASPWARFRLAQAIRQLERLDSDSA
jgi:HEAT repeat protein